MVQFLGSIPSFNGSNYLNCSKSSGLTLADGGTISAWIKAYPAQNGDWTSVVTKGRHSWRLCQYGFGTGNTIAFHFNSPSYEYQANGGIPAMDNTWHHLAATCGTQSIKLYVDGVLDAEVSTPGPVSGSVVTV
jgi:hypothetical protein